MMNTIYAYTTNTYEEKGWFKIGETKLTALDRVEQQDGTSNPEPLHLVREWQVPLNITDKHIHQALIGMGRRPTRIDKHREWFECSIRDVDIAINNLQYGIARPNSYGPREEQQACVDKASAYFNNGGTEFLVNAKMRFGKTFTSYLIAKEIGAQDILVLTYKPAVEEGWRTDLSQHVLFDGWNYSSGNGFEVKKGAKVNVVFASFQDINDFGKRKWRGITNHHFDLVVIDEMHYGSDTERAKLTLSNLKYDRTLFVSGTPLDALISGRFTEDNTYTWSYADEQRKRRAEFANGWKTEEYRWLPEMEIHTFKVCDEAIKSSALYSSDEQFTMTKMFASDDGETFNDEATVKLWLDQVFGRNVRKDKSPLRTHAADHALWMMPPSVKSVNAMANLLERIVGNEYHIINAAGNNIKKLENVKRSILWYDKTITVSCGRFNTGVTVPEWDMVYMLGDGEAPETYFQTIFRVQSPDKDRRKEKCFVVDFNPERVLKLVYSYAELTARKSKSIGNGVREFLEFAPIIDHSGNTMKEVDAEEIIALVSEAGNFIEKYTSSYLFNRDKASEFSNLLSLEGGVKNAKLEKLVNTNDIRKGKNFAAITKGAKSAVVKQIEEIIIEKAKLITKSIPAYIAFIDSNVNSVSALCDTDENLFANHFDVTRDVFRDMIEKGFLNSERLNRLIAGFHDGIQRDDKYITKALEYDREGMFVSEELTEEMIPKNTPKDAEILVFHSYEMLPILHKKGFTDVTIGVDNNRKVVYSVAEKYGYKVQQGWWV